MERRSGREYSFTKLIESKSNAHTPMALATIQKGMQFAESIVKRLTETLSIDSEMA